MGLTGLEEFACNAVKRSAANNILGVGAPPNFQIQVEDGDRFRVKVRVRVRVRVYAYQRRDKITHPFLWTIDWCTDVHR